jgi:spore coat protein CotH
MKISDVRPLASSLPLLALVACGGGGKGGLPAGPVRDAGGTPADPTEAMFDRERLHELVITVDAKDVPTLNTVSDRVPATITFDGITVRQAGVRNKGATSLRPASGKLSFSIKFDELVPGQRLLGMKKLIVNN